MSIVVVVKKALHSSPPRLSHHSQRPHSTIIGQLAHHDGQEDKVCNWLFEKAD